MAQILKIKPKQEDTKEQSETPLESETSLESPQEPKKHNIWHEIRGAMWRAYIFVLIVLCSGWILTYKSNVAHTTLAKKSHEMAIENQKLIKANGSLIQSNHLLLQEHFTKDSPQTAMHTVMQMSEYVGMYNAVVDGVIVASQNEEALAREMQTAYSKYGGKDQRAVFAFQEMLKARTLKEEAIQRAVSARNKFVLAGDVYYVELPDTNTLCVNNYYDIHPVRYLVSPEQTDQKLFKFVPK